MFNKNMNLKLIKLKTFQKLDKAINNSKATEASVFEIF
jgi:hypothetical protein